MENAQNVALNVQLAVEHLVVLHASLMHSWMENHV
jgi:hypothetical protein